jgi:hypothetical protein
MRVIVVLCEELTDEFKRMKIALHGSRLAIQFVLAGLSPCGVQAAEPTGTVSLACEGTATDKTHLIEPAKPEPVSMGLIINFTTNTVAGFERVFPSLSADRVKIIGVDKTTFGFSGADGMGAAVFGTADRITGDVEATMERWNAETNKLQWATGYSLKCWRT